MSRTKKGKKGGGFEYWGKRANGEGKWLNRPGKETKKITHKRERRKKEIDNA